MRSSRLRRWCKRYLLGAYRVRDLQPEALLSPQRGRRMTLLKPEMVAAIYVHGRRISPRAC